VRPLLLPDPPLAEGPVRLRAWQPGDEPALVASCRDPLVDRYTHVPSPYRASDARAWVAGQEGRLRSGLSLDLAIADAGTDALLGAIGMHAFRWQDRRAEVGYWLAPEARGRGVATCALRLLARWALGPLGLARLDLFAEEENVASVRVAERAGFVREGLLRSYIEIKGRRRSMLVFSLIAHDVASAAEAGTSSVPDAARRAARHRAPRRQP
jgi:RimJ/RimL family protein N-acetyltransferase